MSMTMFYATVNLVFMIAFWGIGIYLLVLLAKLAQRGLKALDIYIEEKTKYRDDNIMNKDNSSVSEG